MFHTRIERGEKFDKCFYSYETDKKKQEETLGSYWMHEGYRLYKIKYRPKKGIGVFALLEEQPKILYVIEQTAKRAKGVAKEHIGNDNIVTGCMREGKTKVEKTLIMYYEHPETEII